MTPTDRTFLDTWQEFKNLQLQGEVWSSDLNSTKLITELIETEAVCHKREGNKFSYWYQGPNAIHMEVFSDDKTILLPDDPVMPVLVDLVTKRKSLDAEFDERETILEALGFELWAANAEMQAHKDSETIRELIETYLIPGYDDPDGVYTRRLTLKNGRHLMYRPLNTSDFMEVKYLYGLLDPAATNDNPNIIAQSLANGYMYGLFDENGEMVTICENVYKTPKWNYLSHLAVKVAERGQGIAKPMLTTVMAEVRGKHYFFWVNEENFIMSSYEKMGYQSTNKFSHQWMLKPPVRESYSAREYHG